MILIYLDKVDVHRTVLRLQIKHCLVIVLGVVGRLMQL